MPNFHALAVFEACGSSTQEIQSSVSSLFESLSHQRVRYHEHELSEGPSAAPARKNFYCMVFVDCDVDAYTEEKALDFANDAFEHISTETCQYLAFGLVPGRQRVQRRREREEASDADTNERGRRRRGTQGRGRRRRDDQEDGRGARQETDQTQATPGEAAVIPESEPSEPPPAPEPEIQAVEVEPEEVEAPTELEVDIEAGEPPAPPPRSSAAMQVTVTVKLRASELKDSLNGEAPQQDLVQMAIAEARNRHPEVPADVAPESESIPLPGGDTLLLLTWKYPAPVPSSKESAS